MTQWRTLTAVAIVTAVVGIAPVLAQIPGSFQGNPVHPGRAHVTDQGRRVTEQQVGQSDQAMQAGITALQSASSALQSGNGPAAQGPLQTAISDMTSALPVYHGWREKAIHSADTAERALARGGPKSVGRAGSFVTRAISDAQTALSNPH